MKKYPVFLLPTGEFKTCLYEKRIIEKTYKVFYKYKDGEFILTWKENKDLSNSLHEATMDKDDNFVSKDWLPDEFTVLICEDGFVEPFGRYWENNEEELKLIIKSMYLYDTIKVFDKEIRILGVKNV